MAIDDSRKSGKCFSCCYFSEVLWRLTLRASAMHLGLCIWSGWFRHITWGCLPARRFCTDTNLLHFLPFCESALALRGISFRNMNEMTSYMKPHRQSSYFTKLARCESCLRAAWWMLAYLWTTMPEHPEKIRHVHFSTIHTLRPPAACLPTGSRAWDDSTVSTHGGELSSSRGCHQYRYLSASLTHAAPMRLDSRRKRRGLLCERVRREILPTKGEDAFRWKSLKS